MRLQLITIKWRVFFCSFWLLAAQYSLYSQDSNDQLETRSNNRELRSLDDELVNLEEIKAVIPQILSVVEEINTIRNSVEYRNPKEYLDSIPKLLNSLEVIQEPAKQFLHLYALGDLIGRLNRHNLETYLPVQRRLSQLANITQNPTEAEAYRDNKLIELWTKIMRDIRQSYETRAIKTPSLIIMNRSQFDTLSSLQNVPNIRNLISADIIEGLRARSSMEDFDLLTQIYITVTSQFKNEVEAKLTEINGRSQAINKRYNVLLDRQTVVDKTVIEALPWLVLFVLLMLALPLAYYKFQDLAQIIFVPGLLLRLITVFLLIIAIVVLGISEKLDSSALSALIGGISGYILRDSAKLIAKDRKRRKKQRKKTKRQECPAKKVQLNSPTEETPEANDLAEEQDENDDDDSGTS